MKFELILMIIKCEWVGAFNSNWGINIFHAYWFLKSEERCFKKPNFDDANAIFLN